MVTSTATIEFVETYWGREYPIRIWAEWVTPEMAQQYVTEGVPNRNPSGNNLKHIKNAINRGYWVFTGETIHLSDKGKLMNGQHRFKALMQTGEAARFLFVEGIPERAFPFIDQGSKKRLKDVLTNAKAKDPSAQAGVTVFLWQIVNGNLNSSGFGFTNPPDNFEGLNFWKHVGNDVIHDAKSVGGRIGDERGIPRPVIGALKIIYDLIDHERSTQFFDHLENGTGWKNSKVSTSRLCAWVNEEVAARKALRKIRERTGLFDNAEIAVVIHYAWMNFLSDKVFSKPSMFKPPMYTRAKDEGESGLMEKKFLLEVLSDLKISGAQAIEREHGIFDPTG